MTEPYGMTIFCDDIRQERNAKLLYIGVYQHALIFQGDFPLRLPKFCIAVNFVGPPELREDIEAVEIRVYLPGDSAEKPSIAIKPGIQELPAEEEPEPGEPIDILRPPNTIGFYFQLVSEGMEIRQEGRIRVRALFPSGAFVYLGSLKVKSRPANEPPR